jgi:hypothetical protein
VFIAGPPYFGPEILSPLVYWHIPSTFLKLLRLAENHSSGFADDLPSLGVSSPGTSMFGSPFSKGEPFSLMQLESLHLPVAASSTVAQERLPGSR